ncbi:hypothetical protein OIDMADRAFT_24064 [Oidiodendron maius Zn]|uniref:Uncharacterized protein n=1 Tax=Oidiodendron maius (strain Zn) TaxID=913774 RepID=A0A0C3HTX3_OIDMZ|nr:hypothetical protein OIDMADRAFT_24064 [Oidiodendron maius Zn]
MCTGRSCVHVSKGEEPSAKKAVGQNSRVCARVSQVSSAICGLMLCQQMRVPRTRLKREELQGLFDWVAPGHDQEHLLQVNPRAAHKRPDEKSRRASQRSQPLIVTSVKRGLAEGVGGTLRSRWSLHNAQEAVGRETSVQDDCHITHREAASRRQRNDWQRIPGKVKPATCRLQPAATKTVKELGGTVDPTSRSWSRPRAGPAPSPVRETLSICVALAGTDRRGLCRIAAHSHE